MALAQHTAKFNSRTNLDIRARHAQLRKREGWFPVQGFPEDPEGIDWLVEYLNSGSKLTFTKWLSRVKKIDSVKLSILGKQMVTLNAKLSCQHKDFLRLADTHHYKSCMSDSHGVGRQQLHYLSDPDVAVLFVPDSAGKYQWRSLLRLVHVSDQDQNLDSVKSGYALVHYRVYGNGPSQAIFRALAQYTNLPVFSALPVATPLKEKPHVALVSPTKHNNPFMQKPVWTDHLQLFTDSNQVEIYANPSPVALP